MIYVFFPEAIKQKLESVANHVPGYQLLILYRVLANAVLEGEEKCKY